MNCVYILTHRKTGSYYYGSTCNFERRQKQHLYQLNNATHTNPILKELYLLDNGLDWAVMPTSTLELARQVESNLIRVDAGNPLLINRTGNGCNISDEVMGKLRAMHLGKPKTIEARQKMSVSKTGMGHTLETRRKMSVTRTGSTQSKDWVEKRTAKQRKPVMVDGVEYPSLTVAAAAFNIHIQSAADRIKSSTDRFKNWFYK